MVYSKKMWEAGRVSELCSIFQSSQAVKIEKTRQLLHMKFAGITYYEATVSAVLCNSAVPFNSPQASVGDLFHIVMY